MKQIIMTICPNLAKAISRKHIRNTLSLCLQERTSVLPVFYCYTHRKISYKMTKFSWHFQHNEQPLSSRQPPPPPPPNMLHELQVSCKSYCKLFQMWSFSTEHIVDFVACTNKDRTVTQGNHIVSPFPFAVTVTTLLLLSILLITHNPYVRSRNTACVHSQEPIKVLLNYTQCFSLVLEKLQSRIWEQYV
jgi:hypothetical protein